MNTKEKLGKLSFLKNQMIKENPNELTNIEPIIVQVFKDIFGIGNEFFKKVDYIYNGFSLKNANNIEKFEAYMKIIKRAEIYITMEEQDVTLLDNQQNHVENNIPSTVFLSYCWADTEKANVIDDYLKSHKIKVARDVRDIRNWQSLKEFMRGIRNQDYAVLLISDSYLKSINCMFEVLEIMKEDQYAKRIFPAVIDSKIYSVGEQIKYVKYWEDKTNKLKSSLTTLEYTNGLALGYELKQTEDIARNIAEFLKTISDMNNPSIENIEKAIYNRIIKID